MKYNSILCVARKKLNFSRRVWCEQYEPKNSHTRLKSNFDRFLIIFFITRIHRVRFGSVNGEASRVKPSKKNFLKKILGSKIWKKILWTKIWKKKFRNKNFGKKILKKKFWRKNFEKKILEKKFWKTNFGKKTKKKISKKNFKKNLRTKFSKKYFEKKIYEKSFDKKNVGKINSRTKAFITKLYSNIDKCYTIFGLLAPFDKTGSNENVCGIWFKIGSVARSHWMQGMRRFERSREKRSSTACELSVTRYHMSGICFIGGTKF